MDFSDDIQVLSEYTSCLANANAETESLIKNINDVLSDFIKILKLKCDEEAQLADEFQECTSQLDDYIDQIHKEMSSMVQVIKTSDQQLKELRTEISSLKLEIEGHIKQNNELSQKCEEQRNLADHFKQKYEETKEECSLHMTYSVAMGSVLANMLWKTSKSQESIETYIESGTLNEFLDIVSNTVTTFQDTYPDELPHSMTHEYKFLVSLFGICINIVAQPDGREYLLERAELADAFVQNFIRYLGYLPNKGGTLLKKLTLMLLYNLTFSKQGVTFIQAYDDSVDNILKCLNDTNSIEIQSIAVALTNLLFNESRMNDFYSKMSLKLSQHENYFKGLMDAEVNSKTKDFCSEILRKLHKDENHVQPERLF